jgi:hypothetical protein
MSRKTCTKCAATRVLSEFYTDKRNPDGLYYVCKDCVRRKDRERNALIRALRPPKPPTPARIAKPCSKCGVERPLTDFYKDVRDATGRTSACKVCEAERKKIAYAENPEVFSERKKSYRARNRDKVLASNSEYKKNNRERDAAHVTARNARKRNAIPPWETDVIAAETQWRKDHPGMTLDHIVPITPPVSVSLGGKPVHKSNRTFIGPLIPIVYGLHTQANWQPLENLQNASKNNRDWPDSPWSAHV